MISYVCIGDWTGKRGESNVEARRCKWGDGSAPTVSQNTHNVCRLLDNIYRVAIFQWRQASNRYPNPKSRPLLIFFHYGPPQSFWASLLSLRLAYLSVCVWLNFVVMLSTPHTIRAVSTRLLILFFSSCVCVWSLTFGKKQTKVVEMLKIDVCLA